MVAFQIRRSLWLSELKNNRECIAMKHQEIEVRQVPLTTCVANHLNSSEIYCSAQ